MTLDAPAVSRDVPIDLSRLGAPSLERLLAAVAPGTDGTALLIDLDALAPGDDPHLLPDAVPALLSGLRQVLQGAVAVISAGPVAEIDSRLSPVRLPALGLAGCQWRGDLAQPGQTAAFETLSVALTQGLAADPRFAGRRLMFVGRAAFTKGLPRNVVVIAPDEADSRVTARVILAALAAAITQHFH